jgi:hypothetical protein
MADQKEVQSDAVELIDRQAECDADERDYHKEFYVYLRYFSTLGTGTIVAIGAFMEKVFDSPSWKALAVVSVLAFLVSVATSTVVYTAMIVHFPGRGVEPDKFDKQIQRYALMLTWMSFIVGIICLAVFVIKNLGK